MTSQSSYTSSKRMSSSAIVRPRLGKNYPQNTRPKPAPGRGGRRPRAADRLTEIPDEAPLVPSAARWSVKSSKERFLNSSCCLLRRPPAPPKNRCVAVGESAQGELSNPVWESTGSAPPFPQLPGIVLPSQRANHTWLSNKHYSKLLRRRVCSR